MNGRRCARSIAGALGAWGSRVLAALPAVAVALALAAPWLSASGSNTRSEAFGPGSSGGSFSGGSHSVWSTESLGLVLRSCETLPGSVPLPEDLPEGWSVPPWVDSGDLPECVPLDVSGLREPPASPEPEPSPSPSPTPTAGPQLLTEANFDAKIERLTALTLFSGGLAICCLAALVFRSRGGR